MTNSNDALRAALTDNTAVEKIAILSNQDWPLARVDMAATLDMIHEIAVAAIYPASPVAGGDLRESAAPLDMLLWCPKCNAQHIDEPSEGWANPPHRSHLCHDCGCIWRPADVATNGVADIKTAGDADTWGWTGGDSLLPSLGRRLTAALSQPAAPVEAVEPVAWLYEQCDGRTHAERDRADEGCIFRAEPGWTETPLYTHPPELAAPVEAVDDGPPVIEQVYLAQGINPDRGPPWRWYVVGPEGEVAYCQTDGGEGHANMIAAALNDRVHILREDLKALPPILIDPTGKGYPTDERPMTVAEFEAVIRADATAIERERCASFIEQNVPVSSNQDDLPAYFGPRRGGNLVGLEYADAIRKGPTP